MAPSSLAYSTPVRSASAGQGGRSPVSAPIDLVQLAANTLGNRDLEIQVLHLFRSQSASTLDRLAAETDMAVRKDLVHTLKGSARAVGAQRIAAVCERLEEAMHAGEAGEAPDLARLTEAVDEADGYIRGLLEG